MHTLLPCLCTKNASFPGSQQCSATPRLLWCALDVPQSFASPLEAAQGKTLISHLCPLLWKALLCFCFSCVEISASKRAEISQTYGGAVFCDTAPHCKAGTRSFVSVNLTPICHLSNTDIQLCRLTEGCSFRRKQH